MRLRLEHVCAKQDDRLLGSTTSTAGPHVLGIEWNAENQLTAVKQGGKTLASFTYDGGGRRATKTAGGVTTPAREERDWT